MGTEKYSEQIELDFFKMFKRTSIASEVTGGVYRFGTRPFGSKKEDIIVEFKQGKEAKVQIGVVYTRVYIQDIISNGRKVKDVKRCGELQQALMTSIKEVSVSSEYLIEPLDTPITIESDDTEEHYIATYLHYKRHKNSKNE